MMCSSDTIPRGPYVRGSACERFGYSARAWPNNDQKQIANTQRWHLVDINGVPIISEPLPYDGTELPTAFYDRVVPFQLYGAADEVSVVILKNASNDNSAQKMALEGANCAVVMGREPGLERVSCEGVRK